MKPLLAATIAVLLALEGGYALHREQARARGDMRQVLLDSTNTVGTPTVSVVLLLGAEDCQNAIVFATMLEGLRPAGAVRRLILVAAPDSIRRDVENTAQNMAINVPVRSITSAQLRTLGLRPTRHIGRLLVLNQQGHLAMMSPLPSTPFEANSTLSLARIVATRLSNNQ